MRVYNANHTGTLGVGENLLLQLELPTLGYRRARVVSWSVSFNGLIDGNVLSFSMTRDDVDGTATTTVDPVVLDGSFQDELVTYEPVCRSDFSVLPTALSVIEGPLQASDTAYVLRQYASHQEPVLEAPSLTSLRCTPGTMVAPVGYKVNMTFTA
jgi:hypothetical protein